MNNNHCTHFPCRALFFILLLVPTTALAQNECTDGESVSVEQIFNITADFCCAKSATGAQNKCLRNAQRKLRKVKSVISNEIFTTTRTALSDLRTASCDTSAVDVPTCTDDISETTAEMLEDVEESKACTAKFQSKRRSLLRARRRALRAVKNFLGDEVVDTLRAALKALRTDSDCGASGDTTSLSCSLRGIPDGANGNVYKQADHSRNAVFVTHNGARSGTVHRTNGDLLGKLTYTGLGNADQNGLRHHYRLLFAACSALPTNFLMKLGNICYQVDKRCGRID